RSSPSTVAGVSMKTVAMPPAPEPAKSKSSRPGSGSATSSAPTEAQWFVRYEEAGKVKVGKMSVPQVLQALRSDKLNEKAQASMNAKGPFLPLAQIPLFEAEAKKMLVRRRTQSRDTNLANQYEKL